MSLLFVGILIGVANESSAQAPSTSSYSLPTATLNNGSSGNAFAGSVPTKLVPGVLPLSLQDAVDRGLKQNLGLLLSRADIVSATGQRWNELSSLLPHITATPAIVSSQTNLGELGLRKLGGVTLPTAVGPFSYFDARAAVTQRLFDWKSIQQSRAAAEDVRIANFRYEDAHDLVVLAVGAVYLQAIADEARIVTDEAQVESAKALQQQAQDQVSAGTAADIDALRTRVQLQTRQQQLIAAKNDFAVHKLAVGRVIGLAPGQEFELTDKSPYVPMDGLTVEEALKRAYASRSDYKAAAGEVRAAELLLRAAQAGYLPTLSFSADYGVAGTHPSNSTNVHDVRGTLYIPIFTGGAVHGDVQQARAKLEKSRERLNNLQAQIEIDVRTSLLNLQSASDQVKVAVSNIDLAEQTLAQSRDRFRAGVTDSVEVVQSQEAVASAHEQYISSLYSYNFAKFSFIRSLGLAAAGVREYFRGR